MIMYLSLHCHHQNDTCIKVGSNESHFNVSLIVRDKVKGQCPQTTTFEEKGESKRIRQCFWEENPITSWHIDGSGMLINLLFCLKYLLCYVYRQDTQKPLKTCRMKCERTISWVSRKPLVCLLLNCTSPLSPFFFFFFWFVYETPQLVWSNLNIVWLLPTLKDGALCAFCDWCVFNGSYVLFF